MTEPTKPFFAKESLEGKKTTTIYSLIAGLEAELAKLNEQYKTDGVGFDHWRENRINFVEGSIEALKQVAGMTEAELIYNKMKLKEAIIRHWGKRIKYTLKGEIKAYDKILGTKPREVMKVEIVLLNDERLRYLAKSVRVEE